MPGNIAHFDDQTLRLIVHSSVGGQSVRVELSNRFGDEPLVLGAVHIALRTDDDRIDASTDRPLTFHHQPTAIVEPHGAAMSDPVSLEVPPRSDLAISIFLPRQNSATTTHILAKQTSYVATPGDQTGRLAMAQRPTIISPRATRPDIGDAFGPSGLDPFRNDALNLSGVRWIVLRFGTNDLADPGALSRASETVSSHDLIAGLLRLTKLAHRRHVQVIGTTIPPFEGAAIAPGMYSAEKEAVRLNVNDWMRSHRAFDALIDLDFILRNPDHPSRLKPSLDSGDHLHPNDLSYELMAGAFPLGLLVHHRPVQEGLLRPPSPSCSAEIKQIAGLVRDTCALVCAGQHCNPMCVHVVRSVHGCS